MYYLQCCPGPSPNLKGTSSRWLGWILTSAASISNSCQGLCQRGIGNMLQSGCSCYLGTQLSLPFKKNTTWKYLNAYWEPQNFQKKSHLNICFNLISFSCSSLCKCGEQEAHIYTEYPAYTYINSSSVTSMQFRADQFGLNNQIGCWLLGRTIFSILRVS